jgi:hypothetical protein
LAKSSQEGAAEPAFHSFLEYSKEIGTLIPSNISNKFMKNCELVADSDGKTASTKYVSVTQQPGKLGAGTTIPDKSGAGNDFIVCDHRCRLGEQDDYTFQGWWMNESQKLVADVKNFKTMEDEAAQSEDASKFAFIPSWFFGDFPRFTCNPFAGMFDTWLLLISGACNMLATWMSALVTKALSSLHKQIIAAVCMAAINLYDYMFMWAPSKTAKIPKDNFIAGIAGLVLSALLYSQAPKAPKKVEAKQD